MTWCGRVLWEKRIPLHVWDILNALCIKSVEIWGVGTLAAIANAVRTGRTTTQALASRAVGGAAFEPKRGLRADTRRLGLLL